MKRLLTILFLSFIVNYSFAQVKVNSEGDIIPTGIYPAVKSSNIKGTVHFFQTLTQRNALPNNFRDTGMIAYVQQSSKFYYLDNGIQNSNWKELILTGYDDKVISGGFVSWISGLTFNVSASIFRKFGVIYYTSDTTITLDPADVNYNRIDLFAVDTTNGGEVIKITGTPSPTPIAPQTQDFQIALTTGITLNVGDTVPSNVSIQKIYDENIEWATSINGGITVNFNDLSNPFTGVKDALVSDYNNIGRVVFTRTGNGVIDGSEVLKFHISLRKPLSSILSIGFFDGSNPSSNLIRVTSNNGLDPNKINQYQTIAIPISAFTFTNNSYSRLIIYASGYDTTGTGGFYLDDIELQSGINNIPSQTDYSNKADSTTTKKLNDSTYVGLYWVKGIPYQKGDTIKTHSTTIDSINVSILNGGKIDTSHLPVSNIYIQQAGAGETQIIRASDDTTLSVATLKNSDDITPSKNADSSISFNFTHPHYTKDQVDSIKATITASGITRTELQDTAAAIRADFPTGGTDTTSLSNRINAKQDDITLTTTGTSGAATLTGAILNIPQYSGGGSAISDSVTEQKTYYHNEFYWNHGLNTSTGAFTADTSKDITDYLPIDGNTSVTISTTDSSDITIYGWTYDTTLTPISEIRSNTLIGTKLKTYTFTTPSNARYYVLYTKAASDSFYARLKVNSTSAITYAVPITPEQFTGTSQTQKIQKAVNFARFTTSPVVFKGIYYLDSAIIVSSGNTLVLNGAKLIKKYGNHDNIIRNEAVAQPASHIFNRGNKNIKVLGIGNAIIQGSTEAWGSDSPAGVGAEMWRSIGIKMANVEGFEFYGLTLKANNSWAFDFEQSRIGIIDNITFAQGNEHLNQDGMDIRRGSNRIAVSNIKGVTQDDMVAITNIKFKDSINILKSIYEPYKTNLDVHDISVTNIHRGNQITDMGTFPSGARAFGSAIRLLTADSLKIHDISISGIYGYPEIMVQSPNTNYVINTNPTVDDMYNINILNAYCPVYIFRPIKNSTFINVPSKDSSGLYSTVKPPNGSLNIYRKYHNSIPEVIDSVVSNVEYLYSLPNPAKVKSRDSTGNASLSVTNDTGDNITLNSWGSASSAGNGLPGTTTLSASGNLILYTDNALSSGGTHRIIFRTGGMNSTLQRMQIYSNGAVTVGNAADTTMHLFYTEGSLFGRTLTTSSITGGVVTGQYGGQSFGGLQFNSTSNANKGSFNFDSKVAIDGRLARLGLGTLTPSYSIDITGTGGASPMEGRITNTSTNYNIYTSWTVANSNSLGYFRKLSSNWTPTSNMLGSDLNIYNATQGNISITNGYSGGNISLATVGGTAITIDSLGRILYPATNTATGTTGAQTINKNSGKVNFAAGASTLVVTNSLVTANSIITVTVEGSDATAESARVTPASGSFTITLNAAATAETKVAFIVINK